MKKPKLKTKRLGDIEYTESSGNVFADLDIDNPEEALAKSEIVLKISQPKVSLLLRGYLTDFSLERLLRFLNDLGQDVCISITPASHGHGSTWVGNSPSGKRIATLGR